MSYVVDGDRVPAGGPEDRLLTWNRVKDIAGISRTTAWRMQKVGDFPEPVTISAKRVGWWESELTAWKATRMDNRRPRALAPPRAPKLIETARSPRRLTEPGVRSLPTVEVKPPAASPTVEVPSNPVAAAPPPTAQPSLPLDAPPPATPARSGRLRRAVSPDQTDFGF